MAKRIVFLTGESIANNVNECIHIYRRIVSFKKSADVVVITQSSEMDPEQAGCKQVVHLDFQGTNHARAICVAKQADMFVVVGMPPNAFPSAALLRATKPECSIAIINKGCMDMPNEVNREHVLKIRDMSIGTGLMFLSMYRWVMDLIEE